VNILELLNNFFEEDKTSKLSSSTKLYFFLIYQANEAVKTALKSQVILIDDLGTKTFNWINDKIRLITEEANRNQKSLIISTNLNPQELINSLELRTASRLTELVSKQGIIYLGEEDYRRKKREEKEKTGNHFKDRF